MESLHPWVKAVARTRRFFYMDDPSHPWKVPFYHGKSLSMTLSDRILINWKPWKASNWNDHNMVMGPAPWPYYGHGTGPMTILWSWDADRVFDIHPHGAISESDTYHPSWWVRNPPNQKNVPNRICCATWSMACIQWGWVSSINCAILIYDPRNSVIAVPISLALADELLWYPKTGLEFCRFNCWIHALVLLANLVHCILYIFFVHTNYISYNSHGLGLWVWHIL